MSGEKTAPLDILTVAKAGSYADAKTAPMDLLLEHDSSQGIGNILGVRAEKIRGDVTFTDEHGVVTTGNLTRVAAGGFGAVYKLDTTPDDSTATYHAIKIPVGFGPDGMDGRDERLKSIMKEVQIVSPDAGSAVWDSRGILEFEVDGKKYKSEAVKGPFYERTLDQAIAESIADVKNQYSQVNNIRHAAQVFAQCSNQLLAADHYHSDLKPENIFISKDANNQMIPAIGDWGIAVKKDGGIFHAGTPHYSGPELQSLVYDKSTNSVNIDPSERKLHSDARDSYGLVATVYGLANGRDFAELTPEQVKVQEKINDQISQMVALNGGASDDEINRLKSHAEQTVRLCGSSFRAYDRIEDPNSRAMWEAVHAAGSHPDITRRATVEDLRAYSLVLLNDNPIDIPRIFSKEQINEIGIHLTNRLQDPEHRHLDFLNLTAAAVALEDPRLSPDVRRNLNNQFLSQQISTNVDVNEFLQEKLKEHHQFRESANDLVLGNLRNTKSVYLEKYLKTQDQAKQSGTDPPRGPTPPNQSTYVPPTKPKPRNDR